MRKLLDWLYEASGALAALFVVAIFITMVGASILREAGVKTGGADDLVSWMCAAAAFLAMAPTFRRGDFVRVGLFIESTAPKMRQALEILSLVLASIFSVYLTVAGTRYVIEGYRINEMAAGLIVIPLWIPQVSFVFGAGLFTIAVLDELLTVLKGGKPSYVTAVEERHARGDFSEDM